MRHAVLLVVLVACSSKTKSDDRKFSSLAKHELDRYCEDVDAYRKQTALMPGATKVRCGRAALVAAGAPENTTLEATHEVCVKELAKCLASPPPLESFNCEMMTEQLVKCGDLTVGEMTACSDEIRSLMTKTATEDPCAAPIDPKDPLVAIGAWSSKMKGERCAVIDRKCAAK